jgi:hypothetical protein
VEPQANNAASDAHLAVNSRRDLESGIAALRAELARVRDASRSPVPVLAGWFSAGLLAGLAIALALVRRRRRPKLVALPGTGPDFSDEGWRRDEEPELDLRPTVRLPGYPEVSAGTLARNSRPASPRSISIVSPSLISPASSFMARASWTSRWISRFSGLAPYVGS